MDRTRLACASVLLALMTASPSAVADGEEDALRLRAEHLAHVLGYLGADYARFGGREHDEHVALAVEAEHVAQGLPAPPDVAARVADVRALIEGAAPEADVGAHILALRTALAGAYRIEETPPATPSVQHGRALYEEHCAACHGVTGRADTPAAATLVPPPASFREPLFGETLSPYDVTTAIRFGVDGTAMVPVTALTTEDRWDVAFYVLGLRHPGPSSDAAPGITTSELAVLTDRQLRADLFAAGIGEPGLEPTLAALRRRAPFEARPSSGSLAVARGELDAARVAVARGEQGPALGLVLDAERRGLRPVEIALWNADPAADAAARSSFERLGERVRSQAPPVDSEAAIAATLGALTHAEHVLDEAYGRRTFASWVAWSALVLVRAGLLAALAIATLLGVLPLDGGPRRRRAIHLGWIAAIAFGLAAALGPATVLAVPGAIRRAALGAMSLLGACGAFAALVRPAHLRRPAVLAVAFAAACAGAFDGATSLASFAFAGAPAGGVLLGAVAGALALAVLLVAYTGVRRLGSDAGDARLSRLLLAGFAAAFTAQGAAGLGRLGDATLGRWPLAEHPMPSSERATLARADGWPEDPPRSASTATLAARDPGAPAQAPCSEPGFGPGPELHATPGLLGFDVTHDCLFPGHSRLEVGLNLRQKERPTRDQVDALLRDLFTQVRSAAGKSMPDLTHICAFAAGTLEWKAPYGCLEFETDEGPQGELAVHLDVPFAPEDWARAFAGTHAQGFVGSSRPQVTVDDAKHEMRVVYPYVEKGTARWADHLDYPGAAIHFFPFVYDFYPPKTDIQAITFVGVWRGKPVLTVHVANVETFLSMDPWPIRERMASAGVPLEPGAERTPEQNDVLGREYAEALAKLPRGSVVVDRSLLQN